jgi:hypothetical protein
LGGLQGWFLPREGLRSLRGRHAARLARVWSWQGPVPPWGRCGRGWAPAPDSVLAR